MNLPPIGYQHYQSRREESGSPLPKVRVKVNPFQLFRFEESLPIDGSLLRSRYRELLLVCHPDKPNGSAQKFKILQESYKFLVDKYTEQQKTTRSVIAGTAIVEKEIAQRLDTSETIPKTNYLRFQQGEKFATKEFNEFFEEHRLESGQDAGYGDWLKSTDEGERVMTERVESVKEGQFQELFEKERAKILKNRSLTRYTPQEGIPIVYSGSSVPATDLDELATPSSFTTKLGKGLGLGGIMGTDLKEALEIGIIDVGLDMPQQTRGLEEMKSLRENVRYHMSPEEQARMEYEQQKQKQAEQERAKRLEELERKRLETFRRANFRIH
jgi:hypothetical protein